MLEMIMKLYYNIMSTSNYTNILTSHHILLLSPLLPQMQMDTSHPILRLPPLLPKMQMNTTNNQVCKFYTTAINHFYKEAKALHSSEIYQLSLRQLSPVPEATGSCSNTCKHKCTTFWQANTIKHDNI